MALLDILDCTMGDLIEPVATVSAAATRKKAVGADSSVGDMRPKRAHIRGSGQSSERSPTSLPHNRIRPVAKSCTNT
jgi:hypothetical protein